MSASELKYMAAIGELTQVQKGARLTDVAQKAGVAKASAYKAIGRLERCGYVRRTQNNGIALTGKGRTQLEEYTACIEFVRRFIGRNCVLPERVAYRDAVNTVCAVGNETRGAILRRLKEKEEKKGI